MGLFSSSPKTPSTKPDYTGLQVQTAVNTLPIPVGWGKFKLAPNLFGYGNFKTISTSQKQGKGGGASSNTTYTYSADVMMGLCEGPISSIGQVWKNNNIFSGAAAVGLTLFVGNTPQDGWSYLFSKYPDKALNYPGTAYLCAANYSLGSSASLANYNFEILTPLAGTGANGVDADPAPVIDDFLTNQQYGCMYPADLIDTTTLYSTSDATTTGDATAQTYWRAVGIAFSPCLSSVETAQSILQRWEQLLNIAVVDSGGVLKFIPYGDEPVTGNGVTYVPNMTPIFDLNDDDYQGDSSDDPTQGSITDIFEAYNVERVTISDRASAYNSVPIEARDEAAINQYGLRIDTGVSATEICDENVAAIVGQLILQRGLYVRNTHVVKFDWRYCGLDPMDIITLTDASLGMVKTAVRIQEIEEDDSGILTFTIEELPPGVGTATAYPKQTNAGGGTSAYTVASPVNPPVIVEPPVSVTGGKAQIWIGASGSIGGVVDPLWGGAEIYVSTDNVTYDYIGSVNSPVRQGVLMTALESYSGPNPQAPANIYWRFVCSADTNGGNADLADIYFYDSSGTRVYPSGGTANGAYTSGRVPDFAFDNNLGTFWECYVGSGGGTTWIQYQFPSAMGFSRLDFFCREDTLGGPASITVQTSDDGVNFTSVGTLTATSWSSGVAKSLYVSPGATLDVDLTMSGGVLGSAPSVLDAANGATMCYVDGELISFVTATLTNDDQYSLTGLYRGQNGTAISAHAVGAPFARLDNALFVYDLPEQYVGQVIYVKLASFSGLGDGLQDPSDCVAYIYTPLGVGGFGPVANALSLGLALDYGPVTGVVTISDMFGSVLDTVNLPIDLGVA